MGYRTVYLKRALRKQGEILELPDLELAIHQTSSGRIIVNYPGKSGRINGYNGKNTRIADNLQERGVGSVVRVGNPVLPGTHYPTFVQENLRFIIRYCLSNSGEICDSDRPRIGLMGTSAGGAAVAAVASDFPEVDKVLLLNASGDTSLKDVEWSLGRFRGELYVVAGEDDQVINPKLSGYYHSLAVQASRREFVLIPGCDHQFKGERNGRILSQAPLWAFAEDQTFPNPDNGIWLYD